MVWLNVAIVLLLIMLEGVFVGAEIALVSLREGQVRALGERGRRGARVAKLARDPNRFLAAVQIGVTTTALLSSAFGAVTLSESAADGLRQAGLASRYAGVLGFLIVTGLISYVTLVVGELAPKRIALQRPDAASLLIAPLLDRLATVFRPVIWLLSRSTDIVVRILGGDPNAARDAISEKELRDLVAGHESLSPDERRIVEEVFASGERPVREVMIPRTEVDFLDVSMPLVKAQQLVGELPHSRFPVVRGSQDEVVGFVHVRDLFRPRPGGRPAGRVGDLTRAVTLLPATKKVLPALSEMRDAGQHIAVVVDEYGGTAGIVTLEDLIEELVGDIRDEYDPRGAAPKQLHGGEVEVDGLLNLDEFAEETGRRLPEGPYETVAGYLMATLGRVPALDDEVEIPDARLTVSALDGRRVARVLVRPLPAATPALGGAPAQQPFPEGPFAGDSDG